MEKATELSVDEMEEAMSIAPKKEKGGHVAIGPWRPDWHKKASAEDAAQALANMPVIEV